jgi:hypothetical protein
MTDGWAGVFIDVPWLGSVVYLAVFVVADLLRWRVFEFGRRTGSIALPKSVSGRAFLARSCLAAAWGAGGLYLMAVLGGRELAWGFEGVFGALLSVQLIAGLDSRNTLFLAKCQTSGRMPTVDVAAAEPGLSHLAKAHDFQAISVVLAITFILILEPLLFGAALGLLLLSVKYRFVRRRLLRAAVAAQAAGEAGPAGDATPPEAAGD